MAILYIALIVLVVCLFYMTLSPIYMNRVKSHDRYAFWCAFKSMPVFSINIGDLVFDTDNYEKMMVCGNCMSHCNVWNRSVVLVDTNERYDLYDKIEKDYPRLVVYDYDHKFLDAKYKLCRFVSYVDRNSFEDIYEKNKDIILVSKEEFINNCEIVYNKKNLKLCLNRKIVVEYYDENKNVKYDVITNVDVYGKVCYVCEFEE